jgi:Tripartite tricarboxylate transporter family receptor
MDIPNVPLPDTLLRCTIFLGRKSEKGHQEPPTFPTAGAGLVPIADAGGQREGAMKLPRRRFLHLAAGTVALPAVSRIAGAQTYPARPITMIVPFAAGGATDVIARLVAKPMGESLGRSIIIENVGGADGSTGTGRAARARPDGYTIITGLKESQILNSAFYSLPYDVLKDFVPISPLASLSYILFTRKTIPAADANELIAWLKLIPARLRPESVQPVLNF